MAARNPEGYDWVQQASGLDMYGFWRDSGVRGNSALTTRGLSDLSFFPRGFGPENLESSNKLENPGGVAKYRQLFNLSRPKSKLETLIAALSTQRRVSTQVVRGRQRTKNRKK